MMADEDIGYRWGDGEWKEMGEDIIDMEQLYTLLRGSIWLYWVGFFVRP